MERPIITKTSIALPTFGWAEGSELPLNVDGEKVSANVIYVTHVWRENDMHVSFCMEWDGVTHTSTPMRVADVLKGKTIKFGRRKVTIDMPLGDAFETMTLCSMENIVSYMNAETALYQAGLENLKNYLKGDMPYPIRFIYIDPFAPHILG